MKLILKNKKKNPPNNTQNKQIEFEVLINFFLLCLTIFASFIGKRATLICKSDGNV